MFWNFLCEVYKVKIELKSSCDFDMKHSQRILKLKLRKFYVPAQKESSELFRNFQTIFTTFQKLKISQIVLDSESKFLNSWIRIKLYSSQNYKIESKYESAQRKMAKDKLTKQPEETDDAIQTMKTCK